MNETEQRKEDARHTLLLKLRESARANTESMRADLLSPPAPKKPKEWPRMNDQTIAKKIERFYECDRQLQEFGGFSELGCILGEAKELFEAISAEMKKRDKA